MGGAVPDHGTCPICAGSWEMPDLCRIMGNARSCAGTREIPVAVPDYGKWRNEAESSREWYFERK